MDEVLKQKVVGALVVAAALIIFVPTIFNEPVLEESLIKVVVPSKPGDLTVADFDVLERRHNLEAAQQRIAAVRVANQSIDQDHGSTSEEMSPIREAVTHLVENIKDVTGKKKKHEELVFIPAWTVQLASFLKKDNAINLRNVLRKQNEKAYIKEKSSPGGRIYRVYVGPMLKEGDASVVQKRLRQTHDLQGMVRPYIPE
ncbi:MAG: SPOR domain-containing protein [Pseudomonadales bacterium]|nr:SPOR domain-containing protein [Pseudomonadales bacterium]